MNAASALKHVGETQPDHPAALQGGDATTYGMLLAAVRESAGVLNEMGVRPGDRVALFLPNGTDFMVGYYATLWLGAIAVSIGAMSTREEAAHMSKDSGAKLLLTTEALGARLADAELPSLERLTLGGAACDLAARRAKAIAIAEPAAMATDDPAAIVYSSGTTGTPKGVLLSHGTVDFVARSKVRYLAITPQDRLLLFLPMHHCFGQNAVMHAAVTAGATLVIQQRFDAEAVLHALAADGVTMMFGVPSTFLALADKITDAHRGTVRYWFSAAAKLPKAVEEQWLQRFGAPIHQGYGLSESGPFASYNHLEGPRPGTVGTPIDGVEMAVVDPDSGTPCPVGAPGEIVIRGPNVMLGYWGRPDDTAEAIRDGWLHSGDIGRLDDDGYFTVEDRVKDMIIVGGENVYPAEVENAIHAHPGVAEVAVYGVAEPYLGEEVRALIVVRDGHTLAPSDIHRICRERLAGFKVPTTIAFADSLPKSPTGKVLKRVLRDAANHTATPQTNGNAEDFVRAWLAERLDVRADAVEPERAFVDYGLNSALGVALARDLGAHLDRRLDPTTVWEFPSLDALMKGLAQRRAAT